MSEAVRFEGVTFRFPETRRPAIEDVTLSIDDGTFVLAVGPTGAGKSTFLRAVNGLVPHFTGGAFRGHVTVDSRDTLDFPPRKLADVVAYVPQDPGASFVLDRVEDELAYGMENLGVDPAHMRRRVEEMLDLLDIEPLRMRSVRTLSGGERQRVAIAAALAAGPRILVLDEPTSQLDPQAAEHVVAALQRLVHDQGMTVVLAEHRLERVAGFVDRAIGFEAGRAFAGEPAEVIRRLALGPPVARLGRLAGWDPVPLTVRDARRMGGPPALALPVCRRHVRRRRDPTIEVRGVEARHGDHVALRDIDLDDRGGRDRRRHGAQRRGQDDAAPSDGRGARTAEGLGPHRWSRAGARRRRRAVPAGSGHDPVRRDRGGRGARNAHGPRARTGPRAGPGGARHRGPRGPASRVT